TQIIQRDITLLIAPAAIKTAVTAPARQSFPFEIEKSEQTPALNPHSLTPPLAQTSPRFPPSRLIRRLPSERAEPPNRQATGRHLITLTESSHSGIPSVAGGG